MKSFLYTGKDIELWRLLGETRHAMYKAREKEMRGYPISFREAYALSIIQVLGDRATPAEISRWLLREPHTGSELLNRMEKHGIVRKVKDLDRKNMVRIEITEKGLEALYQVTELRSTHRIMSCLSKEERQQLRASLEKLWNKALEELGISRRHPFPP